MVYKLQNLLGPIIRNNTKQREFYIKMLNQEVNEKQHDFDMMERELLIKQYRHSNKNKHFIQMDTNQDIVAAKREINEKNCSIVSNPVPTNCISVEKEQGNIEDEQTTTILSTPSSAATNSSTKKERKKTTRKKKAKDNTTETTKKRRSSTTTKAPIVVPISNVQVHKDNSLFQFQNICLAIANESGYLLKTDVLRQFFKRGTDGDSFKGDLKLWGRILLPNTDKIMYSLQNKRLLKIFSQIFQTDEKEMFTDLEAGDVAATVKKFFEKSTSAVKPCNESTLSLQDTDACLQTLSTLTREDDQLALLTEVCKKCTAGDLQIFTRLIKHDLRINAGPKHILDAFHPKAYEAFKINRDMNGVIDQIDMKENQTDPASLNISVKLLNPVQPMLANPCKSLDETLKKYEHGLYAETKYDGERVQLHKQSFDFKYLSRNLKPVQPHKVGHFAEYIKKAFPFGEDMILDCEVLMMDTKTGDPLPFGTLSKHKNNKFEGANPCLIIFDCLYFNGESLLDRPLEERYELLKKNLIDIPNHIQISKNELVKEVRDLESMLTTVLDRGLEGLILKDPKGVYEPGKRHWIKVKRDYLFEGKAADTVDLVVLGAWYGNGRRGGIMSIFLMGCYDQENECWRSVTKVHGTDDKTLETIQTVLDANMVKISRDLKQIPLWLNITNIMVPDFVARDPKIMPVWEITGHQFTKSDEHDVHTAGGISIRFPRLVRVRDDKTWESATTLAELKNLVEISKTNVGSRLKSFFNQKLEANTTISTSAPIIEVNKTSPVPEMNTNEHSETTTYSSTKRFTHCF